MLDPKIQKYEYSVLDYKVIDGDTVSTLIDLGFSVLYQASCRLNGLDAPEHTTKAGQLVKTVSEVWLGKRANLGLIVNSLSLDKFAGRYEGRLRSASLAGDDASRCLNDYLLSMKLAKPYKGDKKPPWLPEELTAIEDIANASLKSMGYYPPQPVSKK